MTIVPNSVMGAALGHKAPSDKLNIAGIGIGGRGASVLKGLESEDIIGLCDVDWKYAAHIFERYPNAKRYNDYRVMFKEMLDEADAVVVATTWITHAMIAIDAMNAGLHVGMEVGGAASIEECWEMVRTSKRTGKICMLLENCCYDRNEMAVFNMVRKGLLGEIIHLEGGYRHDGWRFA